MNGSRIRTLSVAALSGALVIPSVAIAHRRPRDAIIAGWVRDCGGYSGGCSYPQRGVIALFDREAHRVAHEQTSQQGHYRVSLAPGRYRLVVKARGVGEQARWVWARALRTDHQDFDFSIA